MNFSFESLKETLISKLPWNFKILTDSIFNALIEIVAYVLSLFAYYVEYLYRESFWKHAINRESLVSQSPFISYIPHRKIGANGNILITADETFNSPYFRYIGGEVLLKKWHQLKDEGGNHNFYLTEDTIYPNNSTIITKYISAGSSVSNLSQGQVSFNVPAHGIDSGSKITIKGTRFYDGDYIVTNTTTDYITIKANYIEETGFSGTEKIFTGHVYASVREGIPEEFLYKAKGETEEKIYIYKDSIDNDIIDVFIADSEGNEIVEVTQSDELNILNDPENYYYRIENISDFSGITLTFGDGIHSKKLNDNNYVLVRYAITKGEKGNIPEAGVITKFKDTPVNIEGNTAALYITNDDELADGSDYEDIESIRTNGRRLFFSGYRAANHTDWKTIIEKHKDVHKAIVWTDFDIGNVSSGISTTVYISAVSKDGTPLTPSQSNDISINYLKGRKSITDVVSWQELKVVNLRLVIEGRSKYVSSNVLKQEIFEKLNKNYGILNSEFNQDVYSSNVIKLLDTLDNIFYHYCDIYIVEKSEIFETIRLITNHCSVVSSPVSPITSEDESVYILEGSLELYIKRKIDGVWQSEECIAKCSDSNQGQIEGVNTWSITGSINYSNNLISFSIDTIINDPDAETNYGIINPEATDAKGYFLRIVYKTRNGNVSDPKFINDVRLPYFFNITNIDEEDIFIDKLTYSDN